MSTTPLLVADIGGTHARCAMASPNATSGTYTLADIRIYSCGDFANVSGMLERYRDDVDVPLPANVCLAVAGPVNGDRITLTNNDWNFSIEQLRRRFGFLQVTVINDLAAVAYSTPHIGTDEILTIRSGRPSAVATRVVIGAGTGLGVAASTQVDGRWRSVASEAGHAAFCATTDKERHVVDVLRARHDYVSWETLLSGPGLLEVYGALAQIHGQTAAKLRPRDITANANDNSDPLCVETAEMFCAALARFASDAALWFCGFGGVYLSGHICGSLRTMLASATFLDNFTAKGVVTPLLEPVPVRLVLSEYPGLIGAAARAHRNSTRSTSAATATGNVTS